MKDTPPHIEARQREIFLSKSAAERLRLGCSMFGFSKMLFTNAILRESPGLTAGEVRAEFFRRLYADDFDDETLERNAGHLLRHPH